jgi:hypothetical protein
MPYKNKETARAWGRAYYQEHKETQRAKSQAYYQEHKEEHKESRRAYAKTYGAKHRTELSIREAAYRTLHKERITKRDAAHHRLIKMDALNAYGGPKCVCCGETLFEGLAIDHIAGDGAEHRRKTKTTSGMYHWLKKNGYPPGFQVLCATCNVAKGTGDHCPHQDLKGAT